MIAASLLMPMTSRAQWKGYAFQTNTAADTYDSHELIRNYSPFTQMYSALVERCSVAGVATPINIQTFTGLWAGTNKSVVTNGGFVYTNWATLTTNFVTTNCFGSFVYPYTDESGAHSGTGWAYPTHDMILVFDNTLSSIFAAGVFISSNYTDYIHTKTQVISGTSYPIEWNNMTANLGLAMSEQGAGYVTNFTTNVFGLITGALRKEFTHSPPSTNWYALAQVDHITNTVWTYINIKTNLASMYETTLPVVRYVPAGTNPLSAFSLSITGLVLTVVSNQTTAVAGEIISLTATNTPLTNKWWSITGISCTTTPPNTGDVCVVGYTNTRAVYGDQPWDLSSIALDLDERYKVLNSLQYSYSAVKLQYGKQPSDYDGNYIDTNSPSRWADNVASARTIYAEANWTNTFQAAWSGGLLKYYLTYQANSYTNYDGDPDRYYNHRIIIAKSGVLPIDINIIGTLVTTNTILTVIPHSSELYCKDESFSWIPTATNINVLSLEPQPEWNANRRPYYVQVPNGVGIMNSNSAAVNSNYFTAPYSNLTALIQDNIFAGGTNISTNFYYKSYYDNFTFVLRWTFDYK